ncbi:hypothetical protein R1flu_009406 [Riccia fluitans]|uniref:SAP domain-containing protein n=1 Tax=Riccia fluitans TaxID=41844 RepID=A0ABD1Z1Z8_9MARC
MRFLFEAAEGAIAAVVQAAQPSTIRDSQVTLETFEEDPSLDSGEEDPGAKQDELAEDSEGSDDEECELDLAEPLVVYVDCRFDSSHSGYHGTLPIINTEDDRVIEMVTLTRKQTGSSWKIEIATLEEALTLLEQDGLKIQEVVHDDNSQVDAILGQHDIMSSKDLWHKCKNIMEKFKEVLQEKRWSPSDSEVEGATTIVVVAVFLVQQLKDFCKDNGLQTTGSKLQLVQRVSLVLKLPEVGASTEIQRTRPLCYPELAHHDLAYKLKSWIFTCTKNAAKS